MSASLNAPSVAKVTKPPTLSKSDRAKAVIALKVAGLKNGEIAQELGVDRKTIQRDLDESKAAVAAINSPISLLNAEIEKILKPNQRAEKYVALATSAKNEAVSLGALQRIDDLAGIVTEKELVRSKRNEPAAPQAMFMLPPGTSVSVSVSTTSCGPANNDKPSDRFINVTPTESTKP